MDTEFLNTPCARWAEELDETTPTRFVLSVQGEGVLLLGAVLWSFDDYYHGAGSFGSLELEMVENEQRLSYEKALTEGLAVYAVCTNEEGSLLPPELKGSGTYAVRIDTVWDEWQEGTSFPALLIENQGGLSLSTRLWQWSCSSTSSSCTTLQAEVYPLPA